MPKAMLRIARESAALLDPELSNNPNDFCTTNWACRSDRGCSALKAILAGEPDADKLNDVLSSAARPALSVANYLEAAIVLDRHRARGAGERLDRYVAVAQVEFAEVTESQVRTARAAYRNFGKGTGHPAGLNFGDWLEYALAIERDEPLLYKGGDDFKQTDVRSALSA
jgi:ribonuclease VapC